MKTGTQASPAATPVQAVEAGRNAEKAKRRAVLLRLNLDAAERVASKLAEVVRVAADMMKRAPIGEGCQLRVMGFPADVVQVVKLARKLMPVASFTSRRACACEPHGCVLVELEIRAK